MKVIRIEVKGLFGFLDRTIDLKSGQFATIIHAPNGFGKTTILELVDALLRLDLVVLYRHMFSSLEVSFADGGRLLLIKNQDVFDQVTDQELDRRVRNMEAHGLIQPTNVRGDGKPGFEFMAWMVGSATPQSCKLSPEEVLTELEGPSRMSRRRFLTRNLPWIEQTGPSRYYDAKLEESLTWRDIVERYSELLPAAEWAAGDKWLGEIAASVTAMLIKTKRLDAEMLWSDEDRPYRSPDRVITSRSLSVEKCAREVVTNIRTVLGEHSIRSQSMERDLPRRLVEMAGKKGPAPTNAAIRGMLIDIHNKYQRVVAAGILPKEKVDDLPSAGDQLTQVRRILALIAKDQRAKLSVFEPLLNKIETLKTLINSRYQRKSIHITSEDGYVVKTKDGKVVPLGRLSSGEQHQLVLFHELLFKMKSNSLVMIDEPEISLHVAWQEQFLADIAKISQNTGAHFLIATHSPQIIGDRWDLTVDLAGEETQA